MHLQGRCSASLLLPPQYHLAQTSPSRRPSLPYSCIVDFVRFGFCAFVSWVVCRSSLGRTCHARLCFLLSSPLLFTAVPSYLLASSHRTCLSHFPLPPRIVSSCHPRISLVHVMRMHVQLLSFPLPTLIFLCLLSLRNNSSFLSTIHTSTHPHIHTDR